MDGEIVLPTVIPKFPFSPKRVERLNKVNFAIFQKKWRSAAKAATLLARFPLWPLEFRQVPPGKPRQPFCCSLCAKTFGREVEAQNHYQDVHRDAAIEIGEFLYMPCMKITCVENRDPNTETQDACQLDTYSVCKPSTLTSKKTDADVPPHFHCLECDFIAANASEVAAHVVAHGPGLLPAGLADEDLEFLWTERGSTVLNDSFRVQPLHIDGAVEPSVEDRGRGRLRLARSDDASTENTLTLGSTKSKQTPTIITEFESNVSWDIAPEANVYDVESPTKAGDKDVDMPSPPPPLASPQCDIPPTPPKKTGASIFRNLSDSAALSTSSTTPVMDQMCATCSTDSTLEVEDSGRLRQSPKRRTLPHVTFSDEVSVIYYPLVRAYLEKLGHPGPEGKTAIWEPPEPRKTRSQYLATSSTTKTGDPKSDTLYKAAQKEAEKEEKERKKFEKAQQKKAKILSEEGLKVLNTGSYGVAQQLPRKIKIDGRKRKRHTSPPPDDGTKQSVKSQKAVTPVSAEVVWLMNRVHTLEMQMMEMGKRVYYLEKSVKNKSYENLVLQKIIGGESGPTSINLLEANYSELEDGEIRADESEGRSGHSKIEVPAASTQIKIEDDKIEAKKLQLKKRRKRKRDDENPQNDKNFES
eukprot:Platyproteum_vivax@DN5987_c0_g1_i1.p1